MQGFGSKLRERLSQGKVLPLVGVYDAFSAKMAVQRFEGVFCSGFGYAASAFGLPDVGFSTWTDVLDFALRVRNSAPAAHLLVDIDDGFGDENITANLIESLERVGASAVMLEDQKRPRRCGHFEGKEILPVKEYLIKLEAALARRRDLFVIARTDAVDVGEAFERASIYARAGADAVMIEGIQDLDVVKNLAAKIDCRVMVNQINGGKSPNWTLAELESAGVSVVVYSTPCLFSAQFAMANYLDELKQQQRLPSEASVSLRECNQVLGRGDEFG